MHFKADAVNMMLFFNKLSGAGLSCFIASELH